MAKYDLTSNLETKFSFLIAGKEFEFRKPTVREMRTVARQFSGIEKMEDPEEQTRATDNAMNELYKFIVPIGHDSNISDVMSDQPIDVQVAFNDMVKKELGAQ